MVEVSGQLNVPVALSRGKDSPVPVEVEAG